MQRHCTYFLTHNLPWLDYSGKKTDCCLVDYRWLLNTEQWRLVVLVSAQLAYHIWVLSVHTVILQTYHLCSSIYEDSLHKLLKFKQNNYSLFKEKCILCFGANLKNQFLEVECSYLLRTDVFVNKLLNTGTYIIHGYIYTERQTANEKKKLLVFKVE